jgi:hypothetical protein
MRDSWEVLIFVLKTPDPGHACGWWLHRSCTREHEEKGTSFSGPVTQSRLLAPCDEGRVYKIRKD